MELQVFINLNPQITSLPLDQFDTYIKGLENHKEMALNTSKLDWHGELIASIKHCETIRTCLTVFQYKKDIEDGKSGSSQFELGIAELEARMALRGINTETSYKKWKEDGKFSL